MTSNIGSPHLFDLKNTDKEIPEPIREKVMAEMRANFRPEFLNRVDDIVLFKPLTLPEIEKIVDIQLNLLRERLRLRSIQLDLSKSARKFIAKQGYDPVFGARPLKRFLQREVETAISRKLLAGEVEDHSTVVLKVKNGALEIESVGKSKMDE